MVIDDPQHNPPQAQTTYAALEKNPLGVYVLKVIKQEILV